MPPEGEACAGLVHGPERAELPCHGSSRRNYYRLPRRRPRRTVQPRTSSEASTFGVRRTDPTLVAPGPGARNSGLPARHDSSAWTDRMVAGKPSMGSVAKFAAVLATYGASKQRPARRPPRCLYRAIPALSRCLAPRVILRAALAQAGPAVSRGMARRSRCREQGGTGISTASRGHVIHNIIHRLPGAGPTRPPPTPTCLASPWGHRRNACCEWHTATVRRQRAARVPGEP